MDFLELSKKIKSISNSSFLGRLFFWSKITLNLGEIANYVENLVNTTTKSLNDNEVLSKKIIELESNYNTEKKINHKISTELEILKNRNDLLSPLKIKNTELLTELNKLKQEEIAKDAKRDQLMNKWEEFQTSAERRERRNSCYEN